MRYQFQQLLRVSILHDYYTDGLSPDFRIVPDENTRALLSRHQMVMRSNEARLSLMFRSVSEADLTHAAIPLSTGDVMTFVMRLVRPEFFNFTNELPGRGKSLLFTNSNAYDDGEDADNILTASSVTVCGPSIPYTVPVDCQVTAVLTDEAGATWYSETHLPYDKGDREFTIALPPSAYGLYTLSLSGDIAPPDEKYFVEASLQFDRPFGLIRIRNQAPDLLDYEGDREYQIVFTSRESQWNYYLVVTNSTDPDLLKVEDKSTIVEADQVEFEEVADLSGDELPALLSADTTKVRLYRTVDPLTYRQKPRPKFSLLKNETVLISDLPNPDIRKPDTNMFIYV